MKPLYLYLHIPYCHHKCPYCDFNTAVEGVVPETDYAYALMAELDHYSSKPEWRDRLLKTVYFGGGTPSIFNAKIYRRILYAISSRYKIDPEIEITVEANPNDLELEKLQELFEVGVNRLSIGAQSFNEKTLKELGRTHSSEDIINGVLLARNAGFKNISLDLIFGAPQQTLSMLEGDLTALTELNPEHASLYSLTIEKGTEFYSRQGRGQLQLPKDDLVADMLDGSVRFLAKHNLERYEISNFARPGYESRHNSSYWDCSDYLGVGAGAHSMLTGKDGTRQRWANISNPNGYMKTISDNGRAEAWSEQINGEKLGFEYLMLGLRQARGVSIEGFEKISGFNLFSRYPGMVEVLQGSGFMQVSGDTLRLTDKGLSVADSVVSNFLPEGK